MKRCAVQPIRFGRAICGDLAQAERREWWLANGLGGYSSGTIAGTLTRRYHGLLVAALDPPLGRYLVFAKADATLAVGDREIALHTNRWSSGAIAPRGFESIESFRLDGRMPVWRYAIGDLALEMRVWMEPGANTTYVAYRLDAPALGDEPVALRVSLLVNARDHHGETARGTLAPRVEARGTRLAVEHPNWFTFHVQTRGGTLAPRYDWIENFDLPAERERGLGDRDNHLCVGDAVFALRPGEWVGLVGSLDADASPYVEEAMRRFQAGENDLLVRARALTPELIDAPDWIQRLVLAADTFIFARPLAGLADGESVIAGYPWFGDWGRDTMIALAGLTLPTGRYASARKILSTFARFVDGGMLPNFFPAAGATPEYNTVDAALWFIEAWRAYFEVTRDIATLREAFPVLAGVIGSYRDGTRFGIGRDPQDGLLRAGAPGVQLTWMDAKVGDWVVTPRYGKPVEVQALWLNALTLASELEPNWEPAARLGRQSFVHRFWNEGQGCLYDVVDADHRAVLAPRGQRRQQLPLARALVVVLDERHGLVENDHARPGRICIKIRNQIRSPR